MKKLLSILLILSVLITYTIVYAEDNEISFRGIEWYSSKKDVEEILLSDENIRSRNSSAHDIYRMSGTYYPNVTMGSDRVDDGGIVGRYDGIKIAGYEIPTTYIYYVYPIENKKIIHEDDQALMYLIWYPFTNSAFADQIGIHDDLSAKLTSLYGKGKVDKSSKYYTITTWKDKKGNTILLLINDDKDYTSLAYMASDAEKMLDTMKQALKDEAIELEKQQREQNSNNTDGL